MTGKNSLFHLVCSHNGHIVHPVTRVANSHVLSEASHQDLKQDAGRCCPLHQLWTIEYDIIQGQAAKSLPPCEIQKTGHYVKPVLVSEFSSNQIRRRYIQIHSAIKIFKFVRFGQHYSIEASNYVIINILKQTMTMDFSCSF